MRITVEDCLKLEAFSGCKIVSCRRNIDRRVRSVSILDEDSVEVGIERNGVREQLVLTHMWSCKNNPDMQCELVSALGRKGIAALVIYLTKGGVEVIDPRLIKAAEETGLVVIALPDDGTLTYAKLIEQVLDKILYGQNYGENVLNNTIFHLLNFEKYSSFPVALKEAALANEYQIVLMTEEYNPILTIETRHVMSIDDAIQHARNYGSFHPDNVSRVIMGEVITYWGFINIENQKYILMLVDNEDNYSLIEMKKLAEIIELSIGMWKYTPERDSSAEFIKSAIRGDLSFCYTLLEEAGLKGMQFNSVFYAKGIEDAGFVEILEEFKNKYDFKLLTFKDGHDIYGMVYDIADSEKGIETKNACLEMFDKLKSGRKDVRIFHTTGIETLDAATEGFKIINKTWNYMETVFPFKRVFTKYEMAMVCDCVNLTNSGSALKKTYLDLLEPFQREVSVNKGKLLLDTLATFVLDAGMNSNKTAEFMDIHNNTVQYRLKRINEILGAEMTANRIIPGLTMALAIKRLEDM